MDIVTKVTAAAVYFRDRTGRNSSYLYLGAEEVSELTGYLIDCGVIAVGGHIHFSKSIEFLKMRVFMVNTPHHLRCS